MSEIFVTAAAPTREAALAMMAALGVADVSSGEPRPLVQVIIAEVPPIIATPAVLDENGNEITPATYKNRSFWNFWYHSDSAAALMKPEPEGGWQPEHGLFERTYLLEMIDQRTGIVPQWTALSGDTPPGYEMPDGCRLYDPSLIATPALVKVT